MTRVSLHIAGGGGCAERDSPRGLWHKTPPPKCRLPAADVRVTWAVLDSDQDTPHEVPSVGRTRPEFTCGVPA